MRRIFDFEILALLKDMRWAAKVLREEGRPVVADALDDRIEMLLQRTVSSVDVEMVSISQEAA